MKALMRIILGLVLLVVILVGGAALALMTVDPNNYKGQITAAVKESTGRDMAIAGDIDLLFYPVLGFKAAGLSLGNPTGFSEKEFINAGEVQAGVKILPLLDKKIEVTTVRLVEPSITVIKNADGKTNLEFPRKVGTSGKIAAPNFSLSLDGVEISKAQVNYIDKVSGKTTSINPLNLKMPGYTAGRSTPVSMDMVLNNPAPAKPTKLDMVADMKANPATGEYSFSNLKSNFDFGGAKASAVANVALNTKTQDMQITNLETGWQGTSLTGKASVKNFAEPSVTFDLSSPSVDLGALLPKGQSQASNNNPLLPVDLLRRLTMDGKAFIGTLKTADMTMTNVRLNLSARNGVLKADPLTFNMYDGTLSANINVDARGASPVYALKGDMKGMEVGKLITAKMGQDYLTGVANIAFNLNSRGNSVDAIRKASGGDISFDFGRGYINKWQLSKLMNQAIAYFETGKLDPNAADKVYFTSLDGAFSGQNGVFANRNLVLIGPKTHALGQGMVNIGAQTVDYSVRMGLGDNPAKFAEARHLPIRIQGALSKPSYTIDMKTMVEDMASQKIEEKKEEVMDKLFKKLDRSTGVEPSGDAPAAIEPAAPAAPREDENPLKSILKGF